MFTIKRLDHVQLCVPIGMEDEARRFYTEVLGLKEMPKPQALLANGGLWYQVGDIQLHIGVEAATSPSKRHPAFEVDDIDAARVHLQQHGVTIKEEIAIPHIKRFSFFDPFQNRIELLQKI